MNEKNIIWEYLLILVGTFFMAVAISVFFEPNHLVTGGATGLAIIIQELAGRSGLSIPVWFTNLLLNVPLFLCGFKVFGVRNLTKTLFATVLLSAWLYLTGFLPALNAEDYILTSVFGGVLSGGGLGLVFRSMATTGGSDMAASLIHVKIRHISVSRIMFILDTMIIAFGFFIFGPTRAMYAIIAVYLTSRVIDAIQEGLSFAKAAFIISDEADTIANQVLSHLSRGVTGLSGRGMFTRKQRNVLLVVMSSKEIVALKELVREVDPNAFLIVADVREVLGEGF